MITKSAGLDFRHLEKGVVIRAGADAVAIGDMDHRLNISNDNLRPLAFVLER